MKGIETEFQGVEEKIKRRFERLQMKRKQMEMNKEDTF